MLNSAKRKRRENQHNLPDPVLEKYFSSIKSLSCGTFPKYGVFGNFEHSAGN